jgi:hypothetical protein
MTDHPRRLSRRTVNALLASAVAWPRSAAVEPALRHPKSLQSEFLSLFGNPKNAHAIGALCLKSLPLDQSSPQQLMDAVLAAAACDTETMKTNQAVGRRIANQVRREFARGTVIRVDGWLLSLTEARLYALVALSVRERSWI